MKGKERKIEIEFLRLIASFMICVGHVNISLYYNVTPENRLYPYICFTQMACIYGVNVFGLIAGYVNVTNRWSTKRSIRIWIEALFYSLVSLAISYLFFPDFLTKGIITQLLFPISNGTYWFVMAYIGVLIFSPILNCFLNSLNQKRCHHFLLLALVIVSFSFLVYDIYGFGWGYNSIWLIYLYCIGGTLKNLQNEISNLKICRSKLNLLFILLFCTSLLLNWLVKMKFAGSSYYISDRILRYDNVLILLGAIALFCLFIDLDIKSTTACKVVLFMSSGCLGVYLIQVNPIYWNIIIGQGYIYLLDARPLQYMLHLTIHSIISFTLFLLIDKMRQTLFDKFYINKVILSISEKIDRLLMK